jgi:hypothetical protein
MRIFSLVPVAFCSIGMFALQNCGPKGDGCEEHAPVNTYYNISNADKSKIPFSGTDTLVYFSTDGDTAVLYGQGKKAFTEKVAEKWDPDPGCSTYDYNYFENIECVYKGTHPDLNYIFIDFNASVYAPKKTNADIIIGSRTYYAYLGVIDDVSLYNDNVVINSKSYVGKNIYEGHGQYTLPYLYNYQYGLLRITTSKLWFKNI